MMSADFNYQMISSDTQGWVGSRGRGGVGSRGRGGVRSRGRGGVRSRGRGGVGSRETMGHTGADSGEVDPGKLHEISGT